ncbi:MAG TPA: Xaa-Pro peptidase family protein [Syntrophorhabdus sp.]|jgi:Xaa-Pro aminopeptidase|nr:aminopeptidase P family protein [Syntrophorhabdus sp.]MDI9558268.1 Xaa-Pro peptidase family protein [Pseudomonadota bacterium]OQB77898.1 MAG: putative peptidase [Deltaproteobacteria bacterium ADurb.Bin135]MBP8744411.1 aminopeptidase P family protein [Syntrophorhabdus sp.]NMC93680.1 aminopeptidase P family protein [Syntrophorhabdus sp.]
MKYVPREEIESRISKVKKLMEEASLDGAFFHYKIDYYYLAGTMQDSLLFIPSDDEPILFVKREISRARRESPIKQITPFRSIKEIFTHIKPMKRVGLQLDVIPYNDVIRVKEYLGDAEMVNVSPMIQEIRKVKSPFEIGLMERAAEISKRVYEKIPELLREGMTEIELGGILEAYAKTHGHEGLLRVRSLNYEAYTWHILSGRTGSIVSQSDSPMGGLGLSPAFPVGASIKKIKKNEPILVDFGISYHGYHMDQTRMYAIGSMPDLFIKAYEACKEIHYRVLDKIIEGAVSKDIFEFSKQLAEKMGYAEYYLGYGHHKVRFLAHGIGIELAEYPYIAANHNYSINEGTVMAIEPKMVFPKKGSCGIENTVLIEKGSYRVLTNTDEHIIIV